jgi:anti-sigma factor RsiW
VQGAALGKDTGRYHITNLALSRFVDGELDEQDRLRVGDHLNSCGYCRSIVAGYARLNGELSLVARHTRDVPYSVTWRLMSSIEAEPTGLLLRIGRFARSVPATAGSLSAALLLVIALTYLHHNTRPSVSPQPPTATANQPGAGVPVSRSVVRNRLRTVSAGSPLRPSPDSTRLAASTGSSVLVRVGSRPL